MDSFKIFKGYGKVNHLEDQSPPQKFTQKHLITTIAISSILLLTLIMGFMVAALIHESNTEPPESPSSLTASPNWAESINTVCNVTQYPDSCLTAISSLINTQTTKPDPETIFNLSLQVTINELKTLSSSFKTLNDLHSEPALADCKSQLDDAVSRLNDSVKEMEVGPGEKVLTKEKINDIQTWISGAMTDQETCFDGLEEMGSTVLDQVKAMMQKSKECMSNSLAIVSKMQILLDEFGLTLR